MKNISTIPFPITPVRWKENQWAIYTNHKENPVITEEDEGRRFEADFTIVDELTLDAMIQAYTRKEQDPVLDNAVIHTVEVEGQDAIKIKRDYPVKASPSIFPPLPESGWLEEGVIYSYGNGAVMVTQGHNRTIYSPEETPALFSFYRENTDALTWIPNENVKQGWKRMYNGKQYEVIQPHVTLTGWEPDQTPALWNEVQQQGVKPPQWNTANWIQYVVGYQVYDSGKVWEAINTTHTWIQPALTGNGAISWKFVKDWVD